LQEAFLMSTRKPISVILSLMMCAVLVFGAIPLLPLAAQAAEDFVPTADIIDVPAEAMATVPLSLTGTVTPGDATNQDITWSIKDAGETGATITGNTLTAEATGTVTVTASVANGIYNPGVASISAGNFHTVAIMNDGSLWAWGANNNGRLGDGTTLQRTSPVRIGTDNDWKQVAAGVAHTVAIKNNGTMWSWGLNDDGQLGDGTTLQRTSPVRIGTASNWSSVDASNHNLAIRTDGSLWAWGLNTNGQLGNNATLSLTSPVRIGTDNNWKQVVAGSIHTLAIRVDNSLWAWGNNSYYQLGISSITGNRVTPTRVGTLNVWNQVSANNHHGVAIRNDGTLWAWGNNANGQVGNGTTTLQSVPVQIGTAINWNQVATGGFHTIGSRTNGALWAWGYNFTGQLGDGTTTQRTAPVRSGTASDWNYVAAGGSQTFAIRNNGSLWAWGRNANGQIGDGTTTSRDTPVQIMPAMGFAAYEKDFVITVNAYAHTWGDWEVTTPATCITEGIETRICSTCGEDETQAIEIISHNFAADFTIDLEPDCNTEGSKSRHCIWCDAATEVTPIPASHSFAGEFTIDLEPECETDGLKYRICSGCPEREEEVIQKTGHRWDEGVVTTAPTMHTEGVKTFTCLNNSAHTKTEPIAPLGYSCTFGEWEQFLAPTCTAIGVNMRHCSCGEIQLQAIAINANNHTWSAWAVSRAATCAAEGERTRSCPCGKSEAQPTAKLTHTLGNWQTTRAATCAMAGEEVRRCTHAGCNVVLQTRGIARLSCTWSAWQTTRAATTSVNGIQQRTCTRTSCNERQTRNVAATPTVNRATGTYTGNQTVTLTSTVPGARIHYTTNGSNPTASSPSVGSGGIVTISRTSSLRFMVVAPNFQNSAIVTRDYIIKTAKPNNKAVPKSQTVERNGKITLTAPADVTLYFTTDGSTPTTKSTKIVSGKPRAITIKKNTRVRVIAQRSGQNVSEVVNRNYTVKTAKPNTTAAPSNRTVNRGTKITLTAPAGTTLYFTTDGSKPTAKSTKIAPGKTRTITINKTTKVSVRAQRNGFNLSDTVIRTYTVR